MSGEIASEVLLAIRDGLVQRAELAEAQVRDLQDALRRRDERVIMLEDRLAAAGRDLARALKLGA